MDRASAGNETGAHTDSPGEHQATGLQATALPRPAVSPRWAWGALALFFLMNLLVSGDHWLLAAVLKPISEELKLSESEAGWLATVLLLGLAAASVPAGYFADRVRRPRLLAMGFAVWSLATIGTGMARDYDQLQYARAFVGVGEAVFQVVALTMLFDLFPREMRARALAVLFLAVPLGAAVGLTVGGALARVATWQTSFLVVGAPGLVLAMAAVVLPDPIRGLSENVAPDRLRLHERIGPSQEDYVDMMVNSSYTYSVFGITFTSFVLAGLVYWSPTFLTIAKGLSAEQVEPRLGLCLLGAAILGTIAGGLVADLAARTRPRQLFIIPGLALLAAIPCVLLAIYGRDLRTIFAGLFLTEFILFLSLVPCYTIIAGVVMPTMRAVACAVAMASIHLLGDIWSPSLMGWAVDTFGEADSMATVFGRALAAIGAVPSLEPGRDPENLTAGMLVVIPALLIASVVLLAGSRHLPREMALMLAKLRANPRRRPAGSRQPG